MPSRLLGVSSLVVLLGLALSVAAAQPAAGKERLPTTGKAVRQLQPLDRIMRETLQVYQIPGGSLAIAKDGRLVFARGYGWADVENKKSVRPNVRFNLASCSKPITAAAVLMLVDQGKVRLEDKVFALLNDLKPPPPLKLDPRLREITIRQLLHHAGGLPRDRTAVAEVARRLKVELPVSLSQTISVSLGKPLLFDPGRETKYSNLGFLTLRLVVAHVSGQDYETFTAEHVLKPMGIQDAHLDRMEGYWPNEVHRYAKGKSHPGGHGELREGGGSWVLSTVDAMRFLTALEGSHGPRALSPRTYQQMLAPLPSLGKKPGARHNGLGWDVVERSAEGVRYTKNGGVPGIATWIEHLPNGICWAAFFNGNFGSANEEEQERPRKGASPRPWPLLREAIQKIDKWPTHDLFAAE